MYVVVFQYCNWIQFYIIRVELYTINPNICGHIFFVYYWSGIVFPTRSPDKNVNIRRFCKIPEKSNGKFIFKHSTISTHGNYSMVKVSCIKVRCASHLSTNLTSAPLLSALLHYGQTTSWCSIVQYGHNSKGCFSWSCCSSLVSAVCGRYFLFLT